jgi:hypothetical protein
VASAEPPIRDSIASITSQLAHDLVAAKCDWNDPITPAVRDEDTWLPYSLVWERAAARKRNHASEEVTICEPEPQRHACPGREAADCNAPGIDSATCERALERSVNEPDITVPESPRRSGRSRCEDDQPWKVPSSSKRVETSGRAAAARPVERNEERGSPTSRRRHANERSTPRRDRQLVLAWCTWLRV